MTGTLDDRYLAWLYSQVGDVRERNPSQTYWDLLRRMYSIEFIWLIPNDDNRMEDGRELRHEWVETRHIRNIDPAWLALGCSFLEMLIALSRRLAFEGEGHPPVWFWHLIENLELQNCTDQSNFNPDKVDDVIERVIFRTYLPDGTGGLFPLRNAHYDQREIEIWYQMNAYLLDG